MDNYIRFLEKAQMEVMYDFLKKKNVVAVGIGYKIKGGVKTDKLAIIVSVKEKLPFHLINEKDMIPSVFKHAGIEIITDVIQTGEIRKLEITGKMRPAGGGASIGHYQITAGTFGCLVKDHAGNINILSNNHVLANSNKAKLLDPILQPGPYDGGTVTNDSIAFLSAYKPIEWYIENGGDDGNGGDDDSWCPFAIYFEEFVNFCLKKISSRYRIITYKIQSLINKVDCAMARPINLTDVSATIMNIGIPKGVRQAALGMKIKKMGRTTELTTDEVIQTNVITTVSYGEDGVAMFTGQFMAGPMSDGGDSGSVILDTDNYIVGLLFAGSAEVTIFNPIADVLSALNVSIVTE